MTDYKPGAYVEVGMNWRNLRPQDWLIWYWDGEEWYVAGFDHTEHAPDGELITLDEAIWDWTNRDYQTEQPTWFTESDPVEHPSHYTTGKIEVLDFIEDQGLNYHLGNATKYIARAGKKDPAKYKEDLRKAIFYLTREVEKDE